MSNIRDKDNYYASMWEWEPYNECFAGTNIRISDVDGIVERNGRFLMIETKSPAAPIPKGQEILHQALQKVGFTIFVVWGKVNDPRKLKILYPSPYNSHSAPTISINGASDLKLAISKWWQWANSN